MRAEDVGARTLSTSLWAAIDFGTAFVSGLVLAALFVANLGATTYGVYLLVLLVAAPGLLSLVDLGMGRVVVTFVARYRAEGSDDLRRLVTFAIRYFVILAAVVPALTWGLIVAFEPQIRAGLERDGISADVLPFVVALQAISLITLLLEYLLAGLFDYRPIQLSSIAMQLVRLAGAAALIRAGADLALIIAWVAATAAIRGLVLGAWLWARYRDMLRRARFRWQEARGWVSYSTTLLARSAAGLVFNFSDRLLIAAALPIARLAQYDIASRPAAIARALISIATGPIISASATLTGLGRRDALRDLYLRGGRLATVAYIPPLVFLLIQMRSLIDVWVGAEFLPVVMAGQLLLLSFGLTMVPAVGDAILLGMGEAQRTVRITWIAVALNFALSVALILPLGIIGLIIGTFVGMVLSDIWLSRVHLGVLGVRLEDLARGVIAPALVTAILSALAVLGVSIVVRASSWPALILGGGLAMLLAYGLSARFALPATDRRLIVEFGRRSLGGRGRTASNPDDRAMEHAPAGSEDDRR